MYILIFVTILALAFFGIFLAALRRYKRCPSDKILVIYGKTGKDASGQARAARCIHGGAAFVWPLLQDYAFLNLTPIPIDIDLRSALSKQNIRINVPSVFTVGISTEEIIMLNAAERMLGLPQQAIKSIAEDIIFGQLRLTIAMMDIEEINADRDKFLANVSENVETELKKVGLRLINVNIKDIIDESGYIEALGQEAALHAINEAKIKVAQKQRDGEVGKAEAEKEQRIKVSAANATAVQGENLAAVAIANSLADRKVKEAEAQRLSTAAEKVATAKALEEAYAAEKNAEAKRAERDRATQFANTVVKAEIEKERIRLTAEAEAEKLRLEAKGSGDAIYEEMLGKARGLMENLAKQAEGLREYLQVAGGDANKAVMLMIAQQLPEIAKIQVDAIKNLSIDKVVVWDNMGNGKGVPTTANFLAGMLNSLPQYNDLFKMVGLNLPEILVKPAAEGVAPSAPAAK
ncbi:MAG: flotillin family protein [Myxococcales bacterium]|nr:flotillin family protein [Myxococcales bacterium]